MRHYGAWLAILVVLCLAAAAAGPAACAAEADAGHEAAVAGHEAAVADPGAEVAGHEAAVAGHEAGPAGHGDDGGMIHFDPALMLWTLLSFGTMLFLLGKFAFGPIGHALEQREQRIHDSVAGAEQKEREAEETLDRYRARLAEASAEALTLLADARRTAEDARAEVADQARAEARKIIDQTGVEIEQMKKKGIDELRETVAHLSVQIASEVVHRTMDEDEHRRLVDEFLAGVKSEDVA